MGLIGESGCGKSVSSFSIVQLIPKNARIVAGEILFRRKNGDVVDLVKLQPGSREMREIRGGEIGVIFQEPMASLSPVHSVGNQISENLILHLGMKKKEAIEYTVELLHKVGISEPAQRVKEYPHQLSGGMCQRIMIAQAIACNPVLLIADEPTTALDVTIQAQIIELLQSLQEEFHMSILYVTHDLGVLTEVADFLSVMYLGRTIEKGRMTDIFRDPLHPYTRDLIRSIPKMGNSTLKRLSAIQGTVPIPIDLPERCVFYDRCTEADAEVCGEGYPVELSFGNEHYVQCRRVDREL
ncbi:ABC transporter ATP-binding protein [Chloroflexi bacterium TSY]|nr:ABC transporter ATP-binding protein [Chloroflexi bacterium TSY]